MQGLIKAIHNFWHIVPQNLQNSLTEIYEIFTEKLLMGDVPYSGYLIQIKLRKLCFITFDDNYVSHENTKFVESNNIEKYEILYHFKRICPE